MLGTIYANMAMPSAPAAPRITRRSLVILPFAHAVVGFAPASRTNVIVILVDDMGFSDLACYGGEIPTPNLDKLSAGGLRFTQFYNTARCSPSRAALLTGLYPHHAGMGQLDPYIRPGSQGYTGRLSERCLILGEVLGDSGYATSMTGKWHLGLQNGTPPWQRGFDRSLCSPFGELYFPGQSSPRMKERAPWKAFPTMCHGEIPNGFRVKVGQKLG